MTNFGRSRSLPTSVADLLAAGAFAAPPFGGGLRRRLLPVALWLWSSRRPSSLARRRLTSQQRRRRHLRTAYHGLLWPVRRSPGAAWVKPSLVQRRRPARVLAESSPTPASRLPEPGTATPSMVCNWPSSRSRGSGPRRVPLPAQNRSGPNARSTRFAHQTHPRVQWLALDCSMEVSPRSAPFGWQCRSAPWCRTPGPCDTAP